mmetsp:Transcript_20182/g.59914  ORF Transcript_20182/g.59914 Transcript_20182/m.59914 type:complete len:188 (-) Transcript_20182:751-1314(-)
MQQQQRCRASASAAGVSRTRLGCSGAAAAAPRLHQLQKQAAAAAGGRCVAARSASAGSKASSGDTSDTDVVGTKVTMRMPTGLVFIQKVAGGPVTVDEVKAGGEADKTGKVMVGDVLAACSAVTFKDGQSGDNAGHGDRLFDKWERIMIPTAGMEFKTVMDALKSNSPRWGYRDVVMVFQKPGNSSA